MPSATIAGTWIGPVSNAGGVDSFSATAPAGIKVGDLLFIIINDDGNSWNTPANWLVGPTDTVFHTYYVNVQTFYRYATAADIGASVPFSRPVAGGNEPQVVYLVIRNTTTSWVTGVNSASVTTPSPIVAPALVGPTGGLVIDIFGWDGLSGTGGFTSLPNTQIANLVSIYAGQPFTTGVTWLAAPGGGTVAAASASIPVSADCYVARRLIFPGVPSVGRRGYNQTIKGWRGRGVLTF